MSQLHDLSGSLGGLTINPEKHLLTVLTHQFGDPPRATLTIYPNSN